MVDGASFRLADEVRYIQRRVAEHDGRVVTIGQLTLFSTETGDAWIIDRGCDRGIDGSVPRPQNPTGTLTPILTR
jgi:hypothetical protein